LKLSNKPILGNLPDILARFQGKDLEAKCAVYEPPLRSELFSNDQSRCEDDSRFHTCRCGISLSAGSSICF
jgi:hypothetical protein